MEPKTVFDSDSGFTLIEILMVVLLISILAKMAIPNFFNFSSDARTAVTNQKLYDIKLAIIGDPRLATAGKNPKQGYEAHCGEPPTSITDLVTMPAASTLCSVEYDPFTKRGWRGPYLDSTDSNWNKDSWGTPIEVYGVDPPVRTIRSCGPDLSCGNPDDLTLTY